MMFTQNDDVVRVAVIGGGAAGMMAAGTASSLGASVTIFEGTDRLGKKLAITGKGRCNVTNNCPSDEFLLNITKNPRFFYAAINAFSTADTISFFEGLGVELKTERGNRVFPASDKAKDIVDALRRYCSGCYIIYGKVSKIEKLGEKFKVECSRGSYDFDKVIIATGGKSYPLTGSDGSGYKLARELGHSVTALSPSLIPIVSPSEYCKIMQGLSLRNVSIKLKDASGKVLYTDFGEMMFTHFGITGPIVLSASAHIRNVDINTLRISIDLKPALDEKTLDARLLSDFSKNANKDLINSLGELLPSKMIEPFIAYTGIDEKKRHYKKN